jgi:hypothetical protein
MLFFVAGLISSINSKGSHASKDRLFMSIISCREMKLVKRDDFVIKICTKKKVLHLGATDAPVTKSAIQHNRMLHFKLNAVASSLIGMDNDENAISYLRANYGVNNIICGDIEVAEDYPDGVFDVVVMGEVLEHLSNPGIALSALRKNIAPSTMVIITVPNSYSLKGFLRAAVGFERIHQDHTLYHSKGTLISLLHRQGFNIECFFCFVNGGSGLAAEATNYVLRLFPQLAEGIGVVCKLIPPRRKLIA